MDPLATVEQLEARLGRDLTSVGARAEALLRDASAKFRQVAGGQQITESTTTDRLRTDCGRLRLPQRPITDITSVDDIEGEAISFEWDGLETIIFSLTNAPFDVEPVLSSSIVVDVTYKHGYAVIPDDVVAVVCQMAGRALGQPADETGVSQEKIGSYSYSIGGAAAAGPLGMLDDERRVAQRYARVGVIAWLV